MSTAAAVTTTDSHIEPAAVAKVRGYLGKTVKVTLVDDRVVSGTFHVLDSFGNLLLREASATALGAEGPASSIVQKMGTVAVASKTVVRVELVGE